ncbi:hypothetical protein G6F57_014191 [Rhizopus arrhizus]|nr:hypothetical protein G6F57_014191 [Rhizopus arrhizus]
MDNGSSRGNGNLITSRLLKPFWCRHSPLGTVEQYAELRQRKVILAPAEFAANLDCVGGFGGGTGFVLAQRLQHRCDPFTRAGAGEGQRLAAHQLGLLFVEQAVQQLLGRGGQQFGLAQGLEQGAGAGPAVLVTFVARQLLQQQAGGAGAVGGQQQAGGQLFGLAEVVLEGFVQFRCGQADQALVALRFARVQARVLDGDREQGVIAQAGQVARRVGTVAELGDAAQGTGGGAFGEQGAQGGAAAQLDRQAAIDLGVAGEQRRGHAGLAEQFGSGIRVLGVGQDLLPGGLQAHVDATDASVGQQEADQGIGTEEGCTSNGGSGRAAQGRGRGGRASAQALALEAAAVAAGAAGRLQLPAGTGTAVHRSARVHGDAVALRRGAGRGGLVLSAALPVARPGPDGAQPADLAGGGRGPALSRPQWFRPAGHREGARPQRKGGPPARCQHDQPAGGQEPVPLAGPQLGPQGP